MIKTQRLLLRPFELTDFEGLFRMDSDPLVHQYIGTTPLTDLSQAKEIIRRIQQQYQDSGLGRWVVLDKQNGEFLGWAGLKLETQPAYQPEPFYDLGYRFLPAHWGKGYATESASAFVEYGFETLNLPLICATVDTQNHASKKVLQKLGFSLEGRFLDDGFETDWYELKKN